MSDHKSIFKCIEEIENGIVRIEILFIMSKDDKYYLAKALEKNSITNESNRSFGTNNYLAPETNEQKITTKIECMLKVTRHARACVCSKTDLINYISKC